MAIADENGWCIHLIARLNVQRPFLQNVSDPEACRSSQSSCSIPCKDENAFRARVRNIMAILRTVIFCGWSLKVQVSRQVNSLRQADSNSISQISQNCQRLQALDHG